MCLTLGNAATIGHHTPPTSSAVRGYTATSHHAGHLTPGDHWRPLPDQRPRTVTDIHRHAGVITLTDQYGTTWTYPATSVIPTAVPDPLQPRISTDGGRAPAADHSPRERHVPPQHQPSPDTSRGDHHGEPQSAAGKSTGTSTTKPCFTPIQTGPSGPKPEGAHHVR